MRKEATKIVTKSELFEIQFYSAMIYDKCNEPSFKKYCEGKDDDGTLVDCVKDRKCTNLMVIERIGARLHFAFRHKCLDLKRINTVNIFHGKNELGLIFSCTFPLSVWRVTSSRTGEFKWGENFKLRLNETGDFIGISFSTFSILDTNLGFEFNANKYTYNITWLRTQHEVLLPGFTSPFNYDTNCGHKLTTICFGLKEGCEKIFNCRVLLIMSANQTLLTLRVKYWAISVDAQYMVHRESTENKVVCNASNYHIRDESISSAECISVFNVVNAKEIKAITFGSGHEQRKIYTAQFIKL